MAATELSNLPLTLENIEEMSKSAAIGYAQKWLQICDGFAAWHYDRFCRHEPTSEEARASDRCLPWLIRATALIHSQMVDPDWPEKELAEALDAALWRLRLMWDMNHNPLSDAEAAAVIERLFPADESRT